MIKDIKGILIDNKECLIHEISMYDEFYYLAISDIEYVDAKGISPGRFVEIIK